MDSKLKKRAVAISTLGILLLITVVLFINFPRSEKTGRKPTDINDVALDEQGNEQTEVETDSLRDFLEDEDFFDEETEKPILIDSQNAVRVTMSCNSVYKDIRIQILNSNKELVTGEKFEVIVTSPKDKSLNAVYTDGDNNGIVVISGLTPGDYEVRLNEKEGYRMPRAPIKINVTDVIAFEYISDIHLFVRQEKDINTMAEDAGNLYIGKDEDDTKSLELIKLNDGEMLGIDISSLNGEIDFTKVQAAGVQFVLIRCGYRGMTMGQLIEDAYFRQNIEDALAVGMKVGVYVTSQAVTELEAVEEASMAIKMCREYAVSYPIFIEQHSSFSENGKESRADILDPITRTALAAAFCETVENAGYRTGIMASPTWLADEVKMNALNKYYTYLAEYREKPTYEGSYVFWRYTDEAWVNGVNGRCNAVLGYYE